MNDFLDAFENIGDVYKNGAIDTTIILAVLMMCALLCFYEFVVYRFVSHRAFYNKQVNVSVALLPFFIATIVLCLQSNIVITLGTIGALAIIRFRTAIKDPIDMIYILWSVHIGIICGCQLYEVAVLTSLVVTIVLLILEHISFGKKPFVLIIHTKKNKEDEIKDILVKYTKKYRIKSRNFTSNGIDYAIEFTVKNPSNLADELNDNKNVDRFSIIEYDADDLI